MSDISAPALNLEDVFTRGRPYHNFVEPTEFPRLRTAIRTSGLGVVVEGPSGIGKTTATDKVLSEIGVSEEARLWMRNPRDLELVTLIEQVWDDPAGVGTVVIEDAHLLSAGTRATLADMMKLIADRARPDSKVVLIGISGAASSLVHMAGDLTGRIVRVELGQEPDAKIRQLIALGESALNIRIGAADEIARQACGSFSLAQQLCHEACLAGNVETTQPRRRTIAPRYGQLSLRVMRDLRERFHGDAIDFARGPARRLSGRKPYLRILQWLGDSKDATIDLRTKMAQHPDLRESLRGIVRERDGGGSQLAQFLERPKFADVLHFDEVTQRLAIHDPRLWFYLRHLDWREFVRECGFKKERRLATRDFALTFDGKDRRLAQALRDALSERGYSVFYDNDNQAKLLALPIEKALADEYQETGSRYVIALVGPEYGLRRWTAFERSVFEGRIQAGEVIPVFTRGHRADAFHPLADIGHLRFDEEAPPRGEAARLANVIDEWFEDMEDGLYGQGAQDGLEGL